MGHTGKTKDYYLSETDLIYKDIKDGAPATEPDRQYYFMRKLKSEVSRFAEKKKRPPRAFCQSIGCQMNARDSEKLLGILESCGFEVSDSEENAEMIIYNTCTVRENANQKVYGRLGHIGARKKNNKDLIVALCGCMMQEKSAFLTVKEKYAFVDIIFGTHNVYKLSELLYLRLKLNRQIIDIADEADITVEDLPSLRKYPFKSGVNISYGCNNFCSYCIVPYVRGRERSRPHEQILKEIRNLADDGVIEVMLLGQNVNSYGNDLDNELPFSELLKQVESIEKIKRIRFMTSHPKDLSDELIDTIKNSDKICRHIHLPLQSGSTKILEKMNRKYTKEGYLSLVEKLRTNIPDIFITTDIITGFPGETEEDFCDTLDVVKKARFENAFTFIYSKRTGTPASLMKDQVPHEVVSERFDRLLTLVQKNAKEATDALEGQHAKALIEELNPKKKGYVTARLSNNLLVHLKSDESDIGKIVNVKLDKSCGFYYEGTVI